MKTKKKRRSRCRCDDDYVALFLLFSSSSSFVVCCLHVIGSLWISNRIRFLSLPSYSHSARRETQDTNMPLKVYMTNITSNQLIIGNQRKLKHILDTNQIPYIEIDMSDSSNSVAKEYLQRTLAAMNQKLLLPQIFHDDQYCCDFDGLMSAVESNTLKQVLKLDQENGH